MLDIKELNPLRVYLWDVINLTGNTIEHVYIVSKDRAGSAYRMKRYMECIHEYLDKSNNVEFRQSLINPLYYSKEDIVYG